MSGLPRPCFYRWLTLCPLLACGLSGCGQSTAPLTDVRSATLLLQRTLDAWKNGQTMAELRQLTPPTYVVDDLWQQGFMLKDYRLNDEGQPFGTNVRFQVTLLGSTNNGKATERTVKYLVATKPAQSVAREDR